MTKNLAQANYDAALKVYNSARVSSDAAQDSYEFRRFGDNLVSFQTARDAYATADYNYRIAGVKLREARFAIRVARA